MGLEAVFPDFEALRARDFAGITCPKPVVMLAITPRTGSTHLCAALHAAGQSVEPTEILSPRGPAAQERARRGVEGFAAYLAALFADPDPAFIFKTTWHDLAPLAPAVPHLFPRLRVVFIERRNAIAQAVSLLRGEVLNIWHARPGQPHRRLTAAEAAAAFDLPRLRQIMRNIAAENRLWEDWFSCQGITPLRLRYEAFEADINIALRAIAEAAGLPLRCDLPPGAGLEKLADEASADWILRVQKHEFNMS
ncbi:Stf0 family sulfotransferase [Acidocella sp. KAb 2-4]|uniref:Stf0 family sulfotransferase n=1 Tax=Acidocella sp. KAb 2-4 TaxID=2885158 RepID=UPI001D0949BF|nr:Stf0 family sulfotransferase [Acidocella sp. KAb 2-4]MCB5944450.1 hypothetical protein [Acidocella sp. KAb 2-4]